MRFSPASSHLKIPDAVTPSFSAQRLRFILSALRRNKTSLPRKGTLCRMICTAIMRSISSGGRSMNSSPPSFGVAPSSCGPRHPEARRAEGSSLHPRPRITTPHTRPSPRTAGIPRWTTNCRTASPRRTGQQEVAESQATGLSKRAVGWGFLGVFKVIPAAYYQKLRSRSYRLSSARK